MHALTSLSGLILLSSASFGLSAPFHKNSPGDYELAANGPPADGQIDLLMSTAAAAEITIPTAIQRKLVIRPRSFKWPRDMSGQSSDDMIIRKETIYSLSKNDNGEGEHQNPNLFYKREIGTGNGNGNGGEDSEPESGSEPSPPSIPENIIEIGEAQTYLLTRELVRKGVTYFADLLALEALDLNPFISRERATAIASEIVADANAFGTVSVDLDSVLLEVQLLELQDYAQQLERAENETQSPGEEEEEAEEESQPRSEVLQGILQLIDNQTVLLTTEVARRGILIEDLLYELVRSWNPYVTDERARLIAQQIRNENLPDD